MTSKFQSKESPIGYRGTASGAVTQATSKSTGVTLHKPAGRITMNGASLGATTTVKFTVTNELVEVGDTVVVNIASGAVANEVYQAWVVRVAAGAFDIALRNLSAGALLEAVVLNYTLVKGSPN